MPEIWHPDAVPSGLDATSYQRGDGVPGYFSYLTDETATVEEAANGMGLTSTGARVSAFGGPFWAIPAGDASLTVHLTAVTTFPAYAGSPNLGVLIGDMAGKSTATFDMYRAIHQFTGAGAPEIFVQRFLNGIFNASLYNLNNVGRSRGVSFRVIVNAARTSIQFYYSFTRGRGWSSLYTLVPTIAINSWGMQWTDSTTVIKTQVPWYRTRVGAAELTNLDPEGALVDV